MSSCPCAIGKWEYQYASCQWHFKNTYGWVLATQNGGPDCKPLCAPVVQCTCQRPWTPAPCAPAPCVPAPCSQWTPAPCVPAPCSQWTPAPCAPAPCSQWTPAPCAPAPCSQWTPAPCAPTSVVHTHSTQVYMGNWQCQPQLCCHSQWCQCGRH
jgi:hypothetical protein